MKQKINKKFRFVNEIQDFSGNLHLLYVLLEEKVLKLVQYFFPMSSAGECQKAVRCEKPIES